MRAGVLDCFYAGLCAYTNVAHGVGVVWYQPPRFLGKICHAHADHGSCGGGAGCYVGAVGSLLRVGYLEAITMSSQRHPEQRDGEVLIGYWTEADWAIAGWVTKRRGIRVFSTKGHQEEPPNGRFPVFVAKVELGCCYLSVNLEGI